MSAALTARRRLDTPLVPMAVTVVLSTGFVLLRWRQAAGRNLGRFIVIGSKYSNRAALPKGIPNVVGNGYDGQFYYRLALDPFNLSRAAYGIRLDSISRVERMAYPFLAWALAFGQHDRIPLTLVIVNVVAAGVLRASPERCWRRRSVAIPPGAWTSPTTGDICGRSDAT